MVDYSFVRVDYPSISFLFARLGRLLEIVEGECLKGVSLFVGEDCPYGFVLSSLFPLNSCFATVARSLKMSGEVRSSELEMGLSSSDNRKIPEVSSPSTPYKAWNIQCALLEKDEKRIKDRFQFPYSVRIRISSNKDRACHSYADEVCFYEADFASGLHLLVHPFVRELFEYLHLAPAHLVPNSWQIVICFPQRPCLNKRYHDRVEKVREYLGTVRDFDDLISPQSLFLHFLGPEPSSKDDADAATLKAHEALSVDNLNPLMLKSSGDVMSSHIQNMCRCFLMT
ncbi:hypothetical protein SO802_003565 [Lithocarpus litseifolius]|uniref:Transposase (putative) gypsy type domain-containing protein n=1 Tax=Lithocarpus litseifolius TaxID=425828 RepID=A0AAW2E1D2_9ROSI